MPLAPPAWVQAPPAPAPVQDPAQAAVQAPALPFTSLRARYKWALEVGEDRGSGSLTLRLAPATGELVVEVFSFTDRLALVAGDAARGYHLILPREQVDRTVASVSDLPFPFLPQAGSVEALARALAFGEGAGITVTERDASGPRSLSYAGQDAEGRPVKVRLIRKQWEPAP